MSDPKTDEREEIGRAIKRASFDAVAVAALCGERLTRRRPSSSTAEPRPGAPVAFAASTTDGTAAPAR